MHKFCACLIMMPPLRQFSLNYRLCSPMVWYGPLWFLVVPDVPLSLWSHIVPYGPLLNHMVPYGPLQSLKGHVCYLMVVDNLIWSLMVHHDPLYGPLLSLMVHYDRVRSRMVLYGLEQSCMVMYGSAWSHMVLHGLIWSRMVPYNLIWPHSSCICSTASISVKILCLFC